MKARVKSLEEIMKTLTEINSSGYVGLSITQHTESKIIYFTESMISFCELDLEIFSYKGDLYSCGSYNWHKDWLEIIDESSLREITKEEHEEIFRMFVNQWVMSNMEDCSCGIYDALREVSE
jgi:DNA helicase IV